MKATRLALEIAGRTDRGNVRPINEDSFLLPEGDNLALVADGMGGHQAGEVASALAASTIRACARKAAGRDISVKNAVSWVRQANRAIYLAANEDMSRPGVGTTLTFLYFMRGHAMLAHVGDSRCYLMRSGEIYQVTQDHSLVAELLRRGEITEEEAREHPYRNVITRALGTDETIAVDAQDIDTRPGDRFLLCTDGLSNYVERAELRKVLAGSAPEEACARLIDLALSRGGRDNITVIAARLGGEAER